MIKIFNKKYRFALIYSIFLLILTVYILLDSFLIEKTFVKVENNKKRYEEIIDNIYTESTYTDSNIKISIEQYRQFDTDIYVADIKLRDIKYLKTAFAQDVYGENIYEKTSSIASRNNAILAINGDFYNLKEEGYVLKNGVIYRETPNNLREAYVIFENGTSSIFVEGKTSLKSLKDMGAYNIFTFGPTLLKNKELAVTEKVGTQISDTKNPRTAIGMIDKLHYVFVVADGRTEESEGLTSYELASFLKSIKVDVGYNLDGGGSSELYFNNKVINKPTANGEDIKERWVADIVYVGY